MYMDIFVLFVFLFTTFVGLYRGFTREVLGLLSLAGSVIVSTSSNKWFLSNVLSSMKNQVIASGILYVVTFVISIIIFNIITNYLNRLLTNENHSLFDRIFGGLIGFLKAYIFCLFIYFVIYSFTAVLNPDFDDDTNIENIREITPPWLKNSKSYPIFFESILKLDDLIKNFTSDKNPGNAEKSE